MNNELREAIKVSDIEKVKILLDRGADLLSRDHNGIRTIERAVESKNIEVISLVIKHIKLNEGKEPVRKKYEYHYQAQENETDILNIGFKSAILNTNAEIVKMFLDNGADIEYNVFFLEGETPLLNACRFGELEIVKLLLDYNANVNISVPHNYYPVFDIIEARNLSPRTDKDCIKEILTPLNVALKKGDYKVVKLILEKISSQSSGLVSEKTIGLTNAFQSGNIDAIRILLDDKELNFSADIKAMPLLIQVIVSGKIDVAKLIIDKQDINARDIHGLTALSYAALFGHSSIIKLLIEKGLKVDDKENIFKMTALNFAVKAEHYEATKILVESGADVNYTGFDPFGKTMLSIAAEDGNNNIVKLLLDKGAGINALSKNGWTALKRAADSGHVETVKLLLDSRADITIKDVHRMTAFHNAAENGHIEVLKLLLTYGADINEFDGFGCTALYHASNDYETTEFLLKSGAKDICASAEQSIPALISASREGNLRVVDLLLNYNSDVNFKDGNGSTALHQAANSGHVDVIKLLLKRGANPLMKDEYGETAFDNLPEELADELAPIFEEASIAFEKSDNDENSELTHSRAVEDSGLGVLVQDIEMTLTGISEIHDDELS